jgi:hypothetical protein
MADALLTKTKQRKISKHLFDWFGQPITAKEKEVDALAERYMSNVNMVSTRFCLDKARKNLMMI